MEYIYPATIEQDDAGIHVVTFRDVPEAMTQGQTIEEALEMASGALQAAFESRIKDHEEIPRPSRRRSNEKLVELPIITALKVALYEELNKAGVSRSELARTLGVDVKEVRRFLDIAHHTKADRLEEALHKFGKRVSVRIESE